MRRMAWNRATIALAAFAAASCGEDGAPPPADGAAPVAVEAAAPVGVASSDELPNLAAAPTGIDFWIHPNVAFQSMMIVASKAGLAAYNIEDGMEVSRAPGDFDGVAVSYAGFGPTARGLVAAFDADANAFALFGVDNASRLLTPLAGGPTMRGAVRGFCLGRAARSADPTLFVVQRASVRILNLAMEGEDAVAIDGETQVDAPEAVTDCAVDTDGIVALVSRSGAVYRLAGPESFAAPFAKAPASDVVGAAILPGAPADDGTTPGLIAIADGASGAVHLFDRRDGRAMGAVVFSETMDIEASSDATAFGAANANLGALYRDGALALGIGGEAPSVRLAPINGAANALGIEAIGGRPRGAAPPAAREDGLLFDPQAPAIAEPKESGPTNPEQD